MSIYTVLDSLTTVVPLCDLDGHARRFGSNIVVLVARVRTRQTLYCTRVAPLELEDRTVGHGR
jgi:hypothetical protein